MLTLQRVNRTLAASGYAERLERWRTPGGVYFAWWGGDAYRFTETIVGGGVSSLRQCDLEWLLSDLASKRTKAGL